MVVGRVDGLLSARSSMLLFCNRGPDVACVVVWELMMVRRMRIVSDLRGEVWSSPDSRCLTAFLRQDWSKYFLGFTQRLFCNNTTLNDSSSSRHLCRASWTTLGVGFQRWGDLILSAAERFGIKGPSKTSTSSSTGCTRPVSSDPWRLACYGRSSSWQRKSNLNATLTN